KRSLVTSARRLMLADPFETDLVTGLRPVIAAIADTEPWRDAVTDVVKAVIATAPENVATVGQALELIRLVPTPFSEVVVVAVAEWMAEQWPRSTVVTANAVDALWPLSDQRRANCLAAIAAHIAAADPADPEQVNRADAIAASIPEGYTRDDARA